MSVPSSWHRGAAPSRSRSSATLYSSEPSEQPADHTRIATRAADQAGQDVPVQDGELFRVAEQPGGGHQQTAQQGGPGRAVPPAQPDELGHARNTTADQGPADAGLHVPAPVGGQRNPARLTQRGEIRLVKRVHHG